MRRRHPATRIPARWSSNRGTSLLPDGQRLGIVLNHNTVALDESGATNGIPGYLGAIPVLGVGAAIGLFNYFRKGKNVVVRRGTVFTFFPSDDPSVERCQDHPSY